MNNLNELTEQKSILWLSELQNRNDNAMLAVYSVRLSFYIQETINERINSKSEFLKDYDNSKPLAN